MLLAMYLTIENVMSLFLTGMAQDFPNASIVTIQQVISIVMLVELFVQFTLGWLASKLSKRKIVIIFQGGTVLGGLIAYFWGKTIGILFISSIMIGISAGTISTIAKSIVTENFSPEEVPKIIGYQQIAQSVGSIILNLVAGRLAALHWRTGYLTFLFGLLSLLAGIFLLPEGQVEIRQKDAAGNKQKIWTKNLVHEVLTTLFFVCFTYGYYYNIGFLIQEKSLGTAAVTGRISAIFMAAQLVGALLLPKYIKKTGNFTLVSVYILAISGFVCMALSDSVLGIIAGVIIFGFGQGVFTPYVYSSASVHSAPNVITSSLAMVNIGASAGMYLFPYIVTWPMQFIANTASARFIATGVLIGLLAIYELLYLRTLRTNEASK